MKTPGATATAQRERSQAALRTQESLLDVSALPSFAFSHRSLMWWSTAGMMAIEGAVFALAIVTLLFLRVHAQAWPLSGQLPPALLWGTLNTFVMLTSVLPNHWTKRAAEALDLRGARIGMLVCLAWSAVFLAVRVLEFRALNCRWDDDAYGSIVWMVMGLHTVHLVTDFADSAVLAAVLYRKPLALRRFVDVSENCLYWDFVVLSWLPLYAVVYWLPRAGVS
ncbi:MAG TPA: cytochrome c oxidase subunit 3 [Burkholderiaceae bacterium]